MKRSPRFSVIELVNGFPDDKRDLAQHVVYWMIATDILIEVCDNDGIWYKFNPNKQEYL